MLRGSRGRLPEAGLLLLAVALFALHFLHLRADFPNHSPWVDWAKYTDEGWYGDAAIRHYLRGTWRLPGDFNPAVALPVWPFLEGVLFRFTGVGIVAARALTVSVFGGILLCSYFLLGMVTPQSRTDARLRRCFAAAALVLMAAAPFLYAFTRMAILEPLLILLVMLALLTANATRSAGSPGRRMLYAVALGVLVALMIGTKTTAIFLLPSVAYTLWSASGWKLRRIAVLTSVALATVAAIWGVYFLLVIHHGLLIDFRYLFSANSYTGITRSTLLDVVGSTFRDGMWIGSLIYPLSILTVVIAVFRRGMWRDPIFTSLALWALGYMVFMAYHANMQPRYYLVIAVPLMLLLVRGALHLAEGDRVSLFGLMPLLLVVVAHELRSTVPWVLHPQYTFTTAADRVERIVESEPNHSHMVLSISGSDLSLMTGVPSICDDFGTMELEDRIAAYKPGWFVAWNYVEDDKMEALGKFYTLTRVGAFPALDDPDRNLMIVYRLDPKDGVHPKRKRGASRVLPTNLTEGAG